MNGRACGNKGGRGTVTEITWPFDVTKTGVKKLGVDSRANRRKTKIAFANLFELVWTEP